MEKSQAENDDIDALKIRSTNNCGSLLKCPTITVLVATFVAKAFNHTESCNACLVGGKTIIISIGEPNKNVTVKRLTKHMAYVNFHISFFYLCSTLASKIYNFLKNKYTTHIFGGRKGHGCKNLTHTSKRRHVKRPK